MECTGKVVFVLLVVLLPLCNSLQCGSDGDGSCRGRIGEDGNCIRICKSECMRRFHYPDTNSSDPELITDNMGCWEGGAQESCRNKTMKFICKSFQFIRGQPGLHYYCRCCHDRCNLEPMNKTMVEHYVALGLKNPAKPPSNEDEDEENDKVEDSGEFNTISIVVGAAALCVILVVGAVLSVRYRRKKKNLLLFGSDRTSVTTPTIFGSSSSSSEKDRLSVENLDSDIPELAEMHARGRFGCVWRAETPNKTSVAVKIFQLMDKESWLNEQDIFSTGKINGHPHILKFLNACTREEGLNKDLWLVTEFHENGSLYDYYKRGETMDKLTAVHFLRTMANGLAFLHEDTGKKQTKGSKPAITHRDLKSKNVLVKSDMTACIADFGLAIKFKNETTGESHGQVGTRRYMAPEVLEGAINFQRDAFLRIDMYAFALVSWEVMTRCRDLPGGCANDAYMLPYEFEFGEKPDIDLLTCHVVDNKQRPIIKDVWLQSRFYRSVFDTIEDCWDNDAEARLPAGCVEERIVEVLKHADDDQEEEVEGLNRYTPPARSMMRFDTCDIITDDPPFVPGIARPSDVTARNVINLQRNEEDRRPFLPPTSTQDSSNIDNHPL